MRTMKEVDDEMDKIMLEVMALKTHFNEVRTWPSGEPRTTQELSKIAKELIQYNKRMDGLVAEKKEIEYTKQVDMLDRLSDLGNKLSGNDYDLIK